MYVQINIVIVPRVRMENVTSRKLDKNMDRINENELSIRETIFYHNVPSQVQADRLLW